MNDVRTARRLEKALVDDERTNELGVHVHAAGNRIIAQGEVATEDRRQRVLDVLREAAPDLEVTDQLTISAEPVAETPGGHERLPGHRRMHDQDPGTPAP